MRFTTAIAAAAKEQSGGIDKVARAVAEMDKVTQQNAASAEESSSAASELSGQAEELAAMVGAFQLDRRGKAAARSAPAPLAAAPRAGIGKRLPAPPPARPAPPRAAGRAGAGPLEKLFPMDDDTPLRDF